jgi:hypothetical protein
VKTEDTVYEQKQSNKSKCLISYVIYLKIKQAIDDVSQDYLPDIYRFPSAAYFKYDNDVEITAIISI